MITKAEQLVQLRRLLCQVARGLRARHGPLHRRGGRRETGVVAYLASEGPATVSELAAALGVSLPAASTIASALEERGLVERREDPADRRRTVVALNETTANEVRGWLEAHDRPFEKALDALTPDERIAFLKGLGVLADALLKNPRMVLSDRTIARLIAEDRIGIDPYDETLIQPSSVDVRVDRAFRVFNNARYPYIDVKQHQDALTELVEIDDDAPFILHPGEFVLGATLERVRLPDDLVARLEGKSSLGRLGLLIHSTAGFIDPGFDGHVTLELSNVANLPITIYFGMKIGQISFMQMTEPASAPYGSSELGSKYQGQRGPTPSRYWQNFS